MRTATRALRRIVVVALFALAAQALLPYLHANATHSADCAVCCALSHGGARALDAPADPAAAPPAAAERSRDTAPVAYAPAVEADTAGARAPPASLRLA